MKYQLFSQSAKRTMNQNIKQQYQKTLDALQADRVEAERKQQKEKEKV